MRIHRLDEHGYDAALLGLSLSYKKQPETMASVAANLVKRSGGSHLKFLESICVWLDITMPRYWWQQFDTYRVGVTKQSESTMHTLTGEYLTQSNFCGKIPESVIDRLNDLIRKRDLHQLKKELPESFLQRRIVCTNYKALRHIYWQRVNHHLREWNVFLDVLLSQLEHPEFITEGIIE